MRKQILAFLAAFLITGVIALSMFVVGANAALNPNGVAVSNSPAQAVAAIDPSTSSPDQTQIAQLQALVAQYQEREQQYQAALQSDNEQLSQATAEMQAVQQLLFYLQSRGIIHVDNQGRITVTAGAEN